MTDFYQSKEWQALRKKAFKRYGHRCHATGLTEKDGITLSIDHIRPRSKAPHLALKLSNVQVLELGLNKTKGARIVKDWRPLKWKAYYIIIKWIKRVLLSSLFLLCCLWLDCANPGAYSQSCASLLSTVQAQSLNLWGYLDTLPSLGLAF